MKAIHQLLDLLKVNKGKLLTLQDQSHHHHQMMKRQVEHHQLIHHHRLQVQNHLQHQLQAHQTLVILLQKMIVRQVRREKVERKEVKLMGKDQVQNQRIQRLQRDHPHLKEVKKKKKLKI